MSFMNNTVNKKGTVCAPGKNTMGGTCFDAKDLITIASALNQDMLDRCAGKSHDQCRMEFQKSNLDSVKIPIPDLTTLEKSETLQKQLVKNISNAMGNDCHECWLQHPKVVNQLDDNTKFYTFRPKYTSSTNWLSTVDIDNVMDQYERIHPDFMYLGTCPADFDHLPILKMCKFTPDRYPHKMKFGAVINLDPHTRGGSHWVTTYIDTLTPSVYFFDSVGKTPMQEIEDFMLRIIDYFMTYKNYTYEQIDIRYNPIQHQLGNSECGVYSLNFLIRLLGGESFDDIMHNRLSDQKVEKCRMVYFN